MASDKSELIKAAWASPELSSSRYELLLEHGFVTGSSAFASNKVKPADEDWCINIPPERFCNSAKSNMDNGYWEADSFSSVYAHRHGKLLNIICFSDLKLMEAWYMATQYMSLLRMAAVAESPYDKLRSKCRTDMFDKKWMRVRVFRALKDVLHPVRPLAEPRTLIDASKYNICRICGREALNFIDKPHWLMWEMDGICDRCREE